MNEVEIRLNVDVDEAAFDWLAGGKGVVSADDAAKEVLSTWAKEQQRLVKRRATARRLERTPALAGKSTEGVARMKSG